MAEQAGKPCGADRAHDAEVEIGFFQRQKPLGVLLHVAEFGNDAFEPRLQQVSEVGQVGQVALAPQELAADFLFQLLNGPAQCRLGDIALAGGAGEVQRFANGKKIANVVNVHDSPIGRCATPARRRLQLDSMGEPLRRELPD